MAKVKFIKSPTGNPFRLAYSIGQTADINNKELLEQLLGAKMVETATETGGKKALMPKGKTAAKNKPAETR